MQKPPDSFTDPRGELLALLGKKVRELAAAPQDDSQDSIRVRTKLASEASALNLQLFGVAGVEGEKEAKAYFQKHMQGRVIATVAGDVHLFGASFGEMKRGMRKDALKVKLIRNVIEILQSGDYAGRALSHKARTDGLVAFHFFSKAVTVDSLTVKAGVNVGERYDGLRAWGLGHEFNAVWLKREGEKKPDASPGKEPGLPSGLPDPLLAPGYEPGVESGLDSVSTDHGRIIDELMQNVNLVILEVTDAQGNRHPELEDGIDVEDLPAQPGSEAQATAGKAPETGAVAAGGQTAARATPGTLAVEAAGIALVLDDAGGPLARLRLTAVLTGKVAELAAMGSDLAGLKILQRARLAKQVNELVIQLGGKGLNTGSAQALADIAAGKQDGQALAELYGMIQENVRALQDAGGLGDAVELTAHAAITRWAELEEKQYA